MGVDDALGAPRWGDLADGGNSSVLNPDVAGIPGRASAVDDVAVADDEVVRLGEQRARRGDQRYYDSETIKHSLGDG